MWDKPQGQQEDGACHPPSQPEGLLRSQGLRKSPSGWGGARTFLGSQLLQVEERKRGALGTWERKVWSRNGLVPGSRKLSGGGGVRSSSCAQPPLPFPSPSKKGCPLPSNPGLYSMHNRCKGTPQAGLRGWGSWGTCNNPRVEGSLRQGGGEKDTR